MAFTNLNMALSWGYEGTALSIDTNVMAFLQYPVFEIAEEWTNISLTNGSLEVWCQANWTSMADGGSGPGEWSTVWDIGSYTHNASIGAWLLAVNPSGSNLVWVAQSSGSNQVVWTPIDFDAGDWHQIVASWSETNSCIYVDGELATNSGPILYGPNYAECLADGFCVGSLCASGTNAGTHQFHGQLQWLESFSYPLTAEEVADEFTSLSSFISYFGYSVPGSGIGVGGGSGPGQDIPSFPTDTNSDGGTNSGGGSLDGGTNGGGNSGQSYVITTNYWQYTNWWLAITNDPTNAYVTAMSTLSNLTYVILTNSDMSNPDGWNTWQVLLASNSITPAPPIALSSNHLYFKGVLISETGTNGLPDWWCMEYFGTLNVDPYADPDNDGLCNLSEFILGTNPTNANSISPSFNDAQALFLAYVSFDTNCRYALFRTDLDTNTVLVTMSNTIAGSNYQIYSQERGDTNDTWIVETNFIGSNVVTSVPVYLNGRNLKLVGGDGADSDGDGLPNGYEVIATWTDPLLPDTGITGTPDGYKDPDGDGYSNLQEMYNGTNPHVFNAPYGPVDPVADYTDGTNELSFSWQPASGPVVGYAIYQYNESTGAWIPVATNSPTQLTYLLTDLSGYGGQFGVQALYALGVSPINPGWVPYHPVTAQGAIAHGPRGKTYMLTSGSTASVFGFNATAFISGFPYPEGSDYFQVASNYPPQDDFSQTNVYIPISQFTNGVAMLSDNQAPLYAMIDYYLWVNPLLQGGAQGSSFVASANTAFTQPNVPFVDGTAQMKQNIRFLLRAAVNYDPFYYEVTDLNGNYSEYYYPFDHVFSTIYDISPGWSSYPGSASARFDHFAPFQDNYFFCNLVFNSALVGPNGLLGTGFYPAYYQPPDFSAAPWVVQYTNPLFEFPTYNYVASKSTAPISALLPSGTSWVGYTVEYPGDFGGYTTNGSWAISGTASNLYGLAYSSLELTISNNAGIQFATLSPGNNVSGYSNLPVYLGTAEPELQTIGYYFGRPPVDDGWASFQFSDPLPGTKTALFPSPTKLRL